MSSTFKKTGITEQELREVSSIVFVTLAENNLLDDITVSEHPKLFTEWDENWTGKAGTTLIKKNKEDTTALKYGIQALLRSQMIADYNKYSEKGYAPIYARDNFENCWKQYHSLGANGVMDDLREKFLELPYEEEDK